MPRRPDLPCADCGQMMWRKDGANLPRGQARCQPCRRANRPPKPPPVVRTRRIATCEQCRAEFRAHEAKSRFCSHACADAARRKPPTETRMRPTFDPRSELRRGYEDHDPELFFAALVARADTTGDCWIWPDLKSGYPRMKFGKGHKQLHRVVLEVKHGSPLGSQAAHHICAVTACVNPDHLQPVTHRDNAAEMLARQSYLSRIAELEAALGAVAPDHPLLYMVEVA